ncbi:ectoine/hydroxyectoine ABC transporter substrate-binding protein EhuB [Rhodospirillaceae bacterium SYSU D60014]|uniref:ectoine/hydroxyectoine ABC transporter substrate-binding protein EhuB n=1 Tax=Virgifigura deserti TaxID=2268457 RepID=UPI000E667D84
MTPKMALHRTAVAALAGLIATAALTMSATAQDTLEQAREQGYIRVGFANEAPYGYATPAGELTGEAPEIAKAVLKKMGIEEVDGVLTEFGSLIPGLQAGRFDMIAAGMFITPKRCEQIAFSEPSYGIGQAFLVKEGNPKDLQTYEDIAADSEATLGVMAGAIEKDYATKSGVPADQILTFPDGPSGLAAVQAGRVDAFALTSLSIGDLVAKAGEGAGVERAEPFGMVAGESVKGHGGFGFRKEDEALLAEFNKHLAEFIGSPEHLALVEPFGFTKAELPAKTTAELCAGE